MAETPTMRVAVIGAGEMGTAVARRLHDGGCSVVVSLEGRGSASRRRVQALELSSADTLRAAVDEADVVLSIVPPGQARLVAESFAAIAVSPAAHVRAYFDCNAVAPATVCAIEAIVRATGCRFVDAGIIGGPPRAGESGPIVFVSGESAPPLVASLRAAGLDVRSVGSVVGSASALKLSYAGVTKGLAALYALMRSQARANGLEAEYCAVLEETLPQLAPYLDRARTGMRPKANRWIAEMREIATFTAPDAAGALIYEGAARYYEDVAREVAATAAH